MSESKVCTKCGEAKLTENFSRDAGKRDGRQAECKTCARSRRAEWYAKNSKRAAHYSATWRAENPAYMATWRAAHPDLVWVATYRQRCKNLGLAAQIEDFNRDDVIAAYGDGCTYCAGPFEHLDHAVPIAKGGPHALANVRPSCADCNRAKSDLTPEEWQAEQDATADLTPEELDHLIDAEVRRWSA